MGLMYVSITNTSLHVFDRDTGSYIGRAQFVLPAESERALLDLVNYGRVPETLVLLDVALYHPSRSYVPPKPFQTYRRDSILSAILYDVDSGRQTPVEIRLRYDLRTKALVSGDFCYYEAAELSNFSVPGIRVTQF